MPDLWYSLADLPAVRAHVRVWWMVHGAPVQYEVVRSWQQRSKSWGWVTLRDGVIETLPPKGRDKAAWSPEPVCWQPIAEGWTWPGDEPKPLLPHLVPRLEGVTALMREVSDAEAAEMAREMEADRETARAQNDGHAKVFEVRWWVDATAIRYEPVGEISPRMAEGRMLRALAWCGAGRGLTLRTTTVGSLLARMAEVASGEAAAAEAEREARLHNLPRFQPLPRDHEDFEVAMGWFGAINPPERWGPTRQSWTLNRVQRIMLMRTLTIQLSWSDIGASFENEAKGIPAISGPRARQLYVRGMEMCHRVANGGAAYPGRKVVDQIAALKERNREHRRGA